MARGAHLKRRESRYKNATARGCASGRIADRKNRARTFGVTFEAGTTSRNRSKSSANAKDTNLKCSKSTASGTFCANRFFGFRFRRISRKSSTLKIGANSGRGRSGVANARTMKYSASRLCAINRPNAINATLNHTHTAMTNSRVRARFKTALAREPTYFSSAKSQNSTTITAKPNRVRTTRGLASMTRCRNSRTNDRIKSLENYAVCVSRACRFSTIFRAAMIGNR